MRDLVIIGGGYIDLTEKNRDTGMLWAVEFCSSSCPSHPIEMEVHDYTLRCQ